MAATILSALLAVCLGFARGCSTAGMPHAADPAAGVQAPGAPAVAAPLQPPSPAYVSLAESRYGGTAKYLFNESRTHVLCLSQARSASPVGPGQATSPLRFFVYDLQADEVILEDSVENARVQWESETSLKVVITPGMVPGIEPREYGYRFDVASRTRAEL
ncbi:MAG: hypothetical protein MUE60_08550 [Candidatus Eisenbacteria bacterium]|jgi:hypothetical protein|nr:hypothetical protein [Candidatus Eisenbacteria bacterium]